MVSTLAEGKAKIFRPPTVPEEIWSLVPADQQSEILLLAARQLRAGVHPRVTVRKFLIEAGLIVVPSADQAPLPIVLPIPRRPSSAARPIVVVKPAPAAVTSAASFKIGNTLSVQKPEEDEQSFDFDDDFDEDETFQMFDEDSVVRKPAKPLHPFGLKQEPAVNLVPKGHIGHALHRLLGFTGDPGRKAADIEANVLRAIASDPELAAAEPENLDNLGCSVPRHILASIVDLVREEALTVVSDIKSRKENSDPTVSEWTDPSDWLDFV